MAPEGSPDPWVPAVLQDAIGEQGFLGERDENGHIARRVAEKWLRKDETIESPQKACFGQKPSWDSVWEEATQASPTLQTANRKATSSVDLVSLQECHRLRSQPQQVIPREEGHSDPP